MRYRSIFVIAVMLLFCFCGSVGLDYTSVYGDGSHGDHGNMHGRGKTGISGVVSSVSGTTISILNMDIDASVAEVVLKDCDALLNIDDIVEGDIIEVKGNMKDGAFMASVIKIEGGAGSWRELWRL